RGVGIAFLEETFDSPAAPAPHRHHGEAAHAVLRALLPAAGANIRDGGRSEAELRSVAGYTDSREFDELMQLLDGSLRLLTPAADNDSANKRFQLTHDYLVQPLREWLARKQRETRRGRAQLRLVECAAAWDERPDRRPLPFTGEWLSILFFTHRSEWT